MKKDKKNHAVTRWVKAEISTEDWEAFKKIVKPIPVQVALGTMIRSAIEAETKPFAEVVEGILKSAFRGSPS
jgi:3-polyprenyl-4-hydroxybenzoate decarboxylase